MLRRRFMLGDSVPKYPYTITVGYYASEEIPFLGGAYKHSNTNLIGGSKDGGNSFSLLNQSFDGSYGEYTISSDSPELGLFASLNDKEGLYAYVGGLFLGGLLLGSGGEVFNKKDVILSCILSGDIEHLFQYFDSYVDNWGAFPNTISELKLPESLKVIHEDALLPWIGLKQLEIPKSVILLDTGCLPFVGSADVALRTLILKPTTPPISSDIFPNSEDIPEDFKIRVYPHVIDTYKKDEYWSEYSLYIDTINNSAVSTSYIDTLAFTSNGNSVTRTNHILDGDYKIFEYSGELTEVIDRGFWYDTLKSIYLPNSISKIGTLAFAYCLYLKEIAIGSNLTTIGNHAFLDTLALESIIWNAKECGDFTSDTPAFPTLTNLKSFTIGDEVEYLPYYILKPLHQITLDSLTVPSNVKKVGRPFGLVNINTLLWNPKECECVETISASFLAYNIIFSDNVKCIPDCFNADVVKSITIGENVEKIKQKFKSMQSLEKISVPDLSKWCKVIHVTDSLSNTNNQHDLYVKDLKITDLIIPEDVIYIKSFLFANTNITSVKIPNVKHIESYAFYDCPIQTIEYNADILNAIFIDYTPFAGLPIQSVIFLDNVLYIPQRLFADCGLLTDVLLSSSIKKINNFAFLYCRSLSNITIPDSVEYIGRGAFGSTPFLDAFPNGLVYLGKNLYTYKGALPEGTSVTLDNDTISISECCFLYLHLSEILLPDSVKILGSSCFAGTTLNTLSIPESVEEILEGIVSNTPLYDNTENWENGCLYIDNCLLSINWGTFSGTELILKDTTRIMADNVITYNANITKIITNEGLTYLGRLVCLGALPILELFISKTVSKINELFIVPKDDVSLKITVDSDNTVYDSRGCNAVVETASNTMLYGWNIDRVPDTIEYINVLFNPTIQQSVYIPINVKYIGITNALEIIYEGTFELFRGICNSNMLNKSVIIKCSDGDFTIN